MGESADVHERKLRVDHLLLRNLYSIMASLVIIYLVLTYLNILAVSTLGYAAVTLIFGIAIVEVLARIVFYYMLKDIHKAEAETLSNITRIIGFVLVLLIALYIVFGYQYLGGLFVSAGFLGIILGLAAQSTISNFIAGLYLLASNAVEPDDHVILHTWQYTFQPQSYPHDKFVPGISGTIESIGVLYTKVINDEGVPVYIPNNIVAQSLVINYHRAKEHVRKIQFDVDISVPFDKLQKVINEVIKAHGADAHDVKVEYLHQMFYVVTVHVKIAEKDIKSLKSEIFGALIKVIADSKK